MLPAPSPYHLYLICTKCVCLWTQPALPATLDMYVRQSTLLEFNSLDASQTTAAVTRTALVLDTQHTVYSGCRLLDAEFSCIVLCRPRPIDGGNKKSCVEEQQSPEQPDQSAAHWSAKCDHVCDVGADLRPRNRPPLGGPQFEVSHSVIYI